MRFKLISIDLDGTLLDDRGKISEENKKELRKFFQKGGIVVLASGRMTDCVSPFADILEIDCPLIVYNGAMVRLKKIEKREIIFHKPLPSEIGDNIIDYCLKNNFHLNYYLNDNLYAQKNPALKKYADIYSSQTGAVYKFLDDIRVLKGNLPTKLILITDVENEDIRRTRDYQYEYFKKKLKNTVKLVKTNPEYLEFMNKDVDKGKGLKAIAEYYGIERDEIISFGDGENDIEMLLYSGLSVVPSNAKEKVKKVAKIVSEYSNNHSFIAKFLKTNFCRK